MDGVVVGGDVIAGPMPEETLALLRALAVPTYFVRGNAESEVLAHLVGADAGSSGAAVVARWVAARLSPESARFVAGWPATVRLTLGGLGGVLFCHATPGSDTEVFTRLTAEARLQRLFGGVDAAVVVCGHTHMAFDRSVAGVRIVNAGSVGMPYGQPGAHWLLLDGSPAAGPAGTLEFRRSSYDLAEAAGRIRHSAYPQAEDYAASNVLTVASEGDALEVFARLEAQAEVSD